ncbi:disulfide isomerase DsbC N-terminal domain-containing protein [Vibrio mediterranei]|nr:disulfide isomerase DsbC N-terminal domain-containing protein [Vibrio mediterranei]
MTRKLSDRAVLHIISCITAATLTLVGYITMHITLGYNSTITSKTSPSLESIRSTIQTALPNTPIRSVMPGQIEGLYEITTDSGLIYTDKTGRYLFVGGIYDPVTNTDLVKERKAKLGFKTTQTQTAQNEQSAPSQRPPRERTFDASKLSEIEPYLITYKEVPGAPVVIELFDPMCSACRYNHHQLSELDVTIKRLLVVTQGSDEINQQVYCSTNPSAVIDSLITKNSITTDGTSKANCNPADLQKIKSWAIANQIPMVTPQVFLPDSNKLYIGGEKASVWKQRLGL